MGSRKKPPEDNATEKDNKLSESARMTIIVAIIGLLGTLGAAYLSYLSTRPPIEPTTSVSLPSTTPNQVNEITETVTSLSAVPVSTETVDATSTPIIPFTQTPSPTLTVENQLIQLIDNYYTCLNAAKRDDDSTYEKCWNLLSNRPGEFQANLNKLNSGYGFDTFMLFWRDYKVTYSLYSCSKGSAKLVDAEYYLYKLTDLSKRTGPFYLEYSFALDDQGWRIKGGDGSLTSIHSYCESQPRIEKLTVMP